MDRQGMPPRRDEPLTSLVFPAYNPGPEVERTWFAAQEFARTAPGTWELLFVCDGCTDGTPERLARLRTLEGCRVRVLGYPKNRGKGYAVRHGLSAARGHWRIFTDVDLAYSFEDILRLAQSLWAGAEVAIASREHPDSRLVVAPWALSYAYRRHLQGRVFALLARLLLPLRQRDTQAGLKGMSAAAAERILPRLRCDGFGFDCELLTACARLVVPVREVPVKVAYDTGASTTNWSSMRRMIGDLFRIRREWRTAPAPVAVPQPAAPPKAA